ncbi:PIG-L deacetylase family protein [Falsarthrobacter nasiphocae]|uniref:PIG-L deacetylase family protein n=1 Tax=Falsarthrobacter nasiphocae TaxID=189863 RepID=UPI00360D4535
MAFSGDSRAGAALADVRTALVFFAHPDDVDFGAGGTVACLARRGVKVVYCVMTDGDAGGFDDDSRAAIVETRRAEQRRAAEIAGAADVVFLGERDGYLAPSHELIGRVVALMREHRPQIVFSLHPERAWSSLHRSHPDHLACGEIVTRAAFPAVENNYAYEHLRAQGLEAYRLPWLFLFAGPDERTNLRVDVTEAVDTKLRALDVHLSQHPDPEAMRETVRAQLRASADSGQWAAPVTAAEEFHAVCVNGPGTFAGF